MNSLGDAEIVKFLTEEISSEKSNQKALPKLAGWEVRCFILIYIVSYIS